MRAKREQRSEGYLGKLLAYVSAATTALPRVRELCTRNLRMRSINRLLLPATLLWASSVSLAAAGSNVWTITGPEGGQIKALAIGPTTPTTLYAGTDAAKVAQLDSVEHIKDLVRVGQKLAEEIKLEHFALDRFGQFEQP